MPANASGPTDRTPRNTYHEPIIQEQEAIIMNTDGGGKGPIDFSDVTGGGTTSGGPRTYVVKKGDSLSKIAKEVYGSARQWKKIYEANKDKIKNPDLIHPGQEFIIPE
jgi:nucleoid-associated protein YgaU